MAEIITCSFQGRIGNQMFQIATTIGLAVKYKMEYKFPEATLNPPAWKMYFTYLPKLLPSDKITHTYQETVPRYQEIPYREGGMRLRGYFQSEKYFRHCRKEVLRVLNIRWKPLNNYVSIHIRRGDYLQFGKAFPVLPMDYYVRAINYFLGKGYKKFLVFSDEIGWCKQNFPSQKFDGKPTFEYSAGRTELDDLKLMSWCSNNIIANSSFSWWGSWLNRNPKKIVICPSGKKWFGHMDMRDIIPESENWVQLDYQL